MEISDIGTVLSVRKFGERSAIVAVFSRVHGVVNGLVKGAQGKTHRGMLQVGNGVALIWHARLADQLGTLQLELTQPRAAHAMQDALALALISSAAALMEHYLVEREAHPELAQAFEQMLDSAITDPLVGLVHYAKLEALLLAECGFGLDARQCALSGATEGLSHVSPRSGRAVCAAAAGPYLSKLLPLPAFLLQENPMISHEILPDVVDALALTGYFLQHWLVEATGRQLPAARMRLVASVGSRGAVFDETPTPSRTMLPMLDIA